MKRVVPSVIPGRERQLASPESIITGDGEHALSLFCGHGGYGFRARAFGAPRNDGPEYAA
jgi:hypothetical protein